MVLILTDWFSDGVPHGTIEKHRCPISVPSLPGQTHKWVSFLLGVTLWLHFPKPQSLSDHVESHFSILSKGNVFPFGLLVENYAILQLCKL